MAQIGTGVFPMAVSTTGHNAGSSAMKAATQGAAAKHKVTHESHEALSLSASSSAKDHSSQEDILLLHRWWGNQNDFSQNMIEASTPWLFRHRISESPCLPSLHSFASKLRSLVLNACQIRPCAQQACACAALGVFLPAGSFAHIVPA